MNYQQLPVKFVYDDLAVGQREESQAGWVASRLVMMLWRPASTWGLLEDVGEIARRIFVVPYRNLCSTKQSGKQVPLTMALRSE